MAPSRLLQKRFTASDWGMIHLPRGGEGKRLTLVGIFLGCWAAVKVPHPKKGKPS